MTTPQNLPNVRRAARLTAVAAAAMVAAIAIQHRDGALGVEVAQASADGSSTTTPARSVATAPVSGRGAYGWPIRPFHTQHPVRGFFGDPRIGMTPKGMTHTFHFGIDISCPNGTPVYATRAGVARLESFRPETVAVVGADGVELQYWHVDPAVANGQRVEAYRTIVGRVRAPWAHVHLAELRHGRYVNPLRPNGIAPYVDTTRPALAHLTVEQNGRPLTGRHADGRVDLVVEATDTTPLAVPAPWNDKPVTPALIRWRLVAGGKVVRSWTTAVDFRAMTPPDSAYDAVYARWTRQNKAHRIGRYRFYLAHGLDGRLLDNAVIEVEATDTRGDRTVARFGPDAF